eukprot:UN25757
MKRDYVESEEHLNHMTTCSHGFVPCRYGRDCTSHQRVLAGGIELKDRCHHAITFTHVRQQALSEQPYSCRTIGMMIHLESCSSSKELLNTHASM